MIAPSQQGGDKMPYESLAGASLLLAAGMALGAILDAVVDTTFERQQAVQIMPGNPTVSVAYMDEGRLLMVRGIFHHLKTRHYCAVDPVVYPIAINEMLRVEALKQVTSTACADQVSLP